jgi:hypothetical protein
MDYYGSFNNCIMIGIKAFEIRKEEREN